MSSMKGALKALSVLAIIGGVDLAITTWVLVTSEGMGFEPLQMLTMALAIVFSIVLGALGIPAASKPKLLNKLYLPTLLAIWANLGNVLLLVLNGEGVVSVVINAVIIVAYAYAQSRVKKEIGY